MQCNDWLLRDRGIFVLFIAFNRISFAGPPLAAQLLLKTAITPQVVSVLDMPIEELLAKAKDQC
jgi:hypothetical protein